jgi:hypothetical protein
VVGDKHGVAANRLDGFNSPAAGNLHSVASRERNRKTRKIRDISQHRRRGTAIAKMHLPHAGAAQIFFQFANDDSIRRDGCSLCSGSQGFRRTLR